MSKRFESDASKRKRKKNENHIVKMIRLITAFLHQPLAKATGAGSEADALKLTQGNQCVGANQPTASIQPEENHIATAMQDVEQQPDYEGAAMPTENENTDIIQNSLDAKGEIKEPQKSSVNNQNFQLTSAEVNQS